MDNVTCSANTATVKPAVCSIQPHNKRDVDSVMMPVQEPQPEPEVPGDEHVYCPEHPSKDPYDIMPPEKQDPVFSSNAIDKTAPAINKGRKQFWYSLAHIWIPRMLMVISLGIISSCGFFENNTQMLLSDATGTVQLRSNNTEAKDSTGIPGGTNETKSAGVALEVEVQTQSLAPVPHVHRKVQGFPRSELVTLNLTRQQILLHSDGEVVRYESAYWGNIVAGTPSQHFKVVFDTGSGHVILPSMYCRSETCRAHSRYKRSKSTTAKDLNSNGREVAPNEARDQIAISFITGKIAGVFVEDTVCIDSSQKKVKDLHMNDDQEEGCMRFRMILATEMTEQPFRSFVFDGILGLSMESLSQSPKHNFVNVLTKSMGTQAKTMDKVFSLFLAQNQHQRSEISFGGYANEHLSGNLSWNKVYMPELGHWMLQVKSLRVDDEVLDFCDGGCKAVFDSGTSLLAVPTPAFPELFERLRHETKADVGCMGPGPILHFVLEDNSTVSLGPEVYGVMERTKASRLRWSNGGGTTVPIGFCKPLLISTTLAEPIGPKVFILGEPVLRKYYTVYDAEEKRIGIGHSSSYNPRPPAHTPVGGDNEMDDDDSWWLSDETR